MQCSLFVQPWGKEDGGVQLVYEGTCCLAWGVIFDRSRDTGVVCVFAIFNAGGSVWWCVCVYAHTHTHTAHMGYSSVSPAVGQAATTACTMFRARLKTRTDSVSRSPSRTLSHTHARTTRTHTRTHTLAQFRIHTCYSREYAHSYSSSCKAASATYYANGVLGCEPRSRDETPGGPRKSRWTKSRHMYIRICVQSTHVHVYTKGRDEIFKLV